MIVLEGTQENPSSRILALNKQLRRHASSVQWEDAWCFLCWRCKRDVHGNVMFRRLATSWDVRGKPGEHSFFGSICATLAEDLSNRRLEIILKLSNILQAPLAAWERIPIRHKRKYDQRWEEEPFSPRRVSIFITHQWAILVCSSPHSDKWTSSESSFCWISLLEQSGFAITKPVSAPEGMHFFLHGTKKQVFFFFFQ